MSSIKNLCRKDIQKIFKKLTFPMENDIPNLLAHNIDMYNSVKIYAKDLPKSEQEFATRQLPTMQYFHENKIKNVMIYLYMIQTDYIKHLAQYGFEFHHTFEGQQVALRKWQPNTVDKYPTRIPLLRIPKHKKSLKIHKNDR